MAVFNLRLQLERLCAESTAGSTARPGEQLVISVATGKNRASSPGRPFCPVQDPGEQALVHELGKVSDSRLPVHRATEHPSRGSSRVLVTTGSGSNQASSSLRAQEPRRSHCSICSIRTGSKCSGCRSVLCSRECSRIHYRGGQCSVQWVKWRSLAESQRRAIGWDTFKSDWSRESNGAAIAMRKFAKV